MKIEQTQSVLNILVIGANGGIGKNVVEQALEAGHHVTALVRNPAHLTLAHINLEIIQGDILHPEAFGKYLTNQDAVISALGEKKDVPTTLYSEGARNLLAAMKKKGLQRVFFYLCASN